MSSKTDVSALIQTKLHRPRVAGDLIERSHLLERLNSPRWRSFTLISAPAGFGKTTLLSQWLDQSPYPAAWLSLDESENELFVFLGYVVAAIQTLFPTGCATTHSLLNAAQIPPLEYLTTTLINEIVNLPEEFLLVLDDYHLITRPEIHQLVSTLVKYAPSPLHLILSTRKDPPFSIARPRAMQAITELRMKDLRFTPAEMQSYFNLCLGADISPEIVTVLAERAEGWAVGLRLACLSLRGQSDYAGFLKSFQGTHQYIMEYLVDEVLSRQPQPIQAFLLVTSILDRFCAPLGDSLLEVAPEIDLKKAGISGEPPSSRTILAQLERDNLFVVSLDQQNEWYRYHHLFRELLWHKLKAETTPLQRTALHTAAGAWLEQNGFAEEALHHYFAANNTAAAAQLVARQRYARLNRVQWQWLDHWLHRFSPDTLDHYPDLLMLKTWLIYHRGQRAELPAALQRLEAAMAQATLTPEEISHLQGEISALRSLLFYHVVDSKRTLAHARQALAKAPAELWIVRILARLCLAMALHLMGDTNQAYAAIYRGLEEEEIQNNRFKATLVMTVCYVHWLDADLPGMAQAARQCIMLSRDAYSPEILNYGYYHLGKACYQQNDLTAAEKYFTTVVQQPYLNYGECYAHSACGLALTHQAQGQADQAWTVLEVASTFMLETGNTTLMPVIQACQAEIALRQGQLGPAGQWAARLAPAPPLTPIYDFFSPHLTLVKVWLAQDTFTSRQQAADLLQKVKEFVESTHNTRFLIEVLALQALLNERQGEREAALQALKQALTLTQPGGFIQLFVDLGRPMAELLPEIQSENSGMQSYVGQILAAFPTDLQLRVDDLRLREEETAPLQSNNQNLIEPLTYRELDVLELLAQRLSNKEIADRLVISPLTVKTHNKNIFAKLDVKNRREVVARARELGLISSK